MLLEALACQVPVVVRDIPIYREWLPDGEVTHMVRGTGGAIVEDTVQRLTDLFAGHLPDLSEASRAAAMECDLGAVADRLQEIYRSLGLFEPVVGCWAHGTTALSQRPQG